ncbi:unnamed protein product [Sphagnum balticum]
MGWIERATLVFLLLFSAFPGLAWSSPSATPSTSSSSCLQQHRATVRTEVLALQELLAVWTNASTPDIATSLPGWTTGTDPCQEEGAWGGVICQFNTTLCMNTVLGLQLVGTNLHGTLSPSIGNLTNLKILELEDNNFTMTIPDLHNLTSLQTLDLSGNSLEGSIPAWIGALTKLQRMDLSENKLSGSIPVANNVSSIGLNNLTYVVQMNLSNNQFTGSVPSSLGNLKQLTVLDLSHNNFSETFPATMANLSSLQQLYMGSNDLTGPFPVELIWGFANLQLVNFDDNKFNGTLNLSNTTPWVNLSALEVVSLVNNSIMHVLFPSSVASSQAYADLPLSNEILLGGNPYCQGDIEGNVQRQICRFNQDSPLLPASNDSRRNRIIITVAVVVIILLFASSITFLWRMWKQGSSLREIQKEFAKQQVQPTLYSYNELKYATRDFHPDNKLGEGGFGVVYKGVLFDKSEVAVKQLKSSAQGVAEFLNEVILITGIRHRNLVKLKGCCLRDSQRMLVYEYVENKNLAEALWDAPSKSNFELDWPTRFKICLGIARGLVYLHEEAQPRIVHRDIKAPNILLDQNLNPKIGDFGLARLFPDEQSHLTTVHVAGTLGYLSPEYATRGQLTEKLDIYSFGVLVLEIVSGRRNIDFKLPEEKVYLIEWAWKLQEQGRLFDLVETKLKEKSIEEEIKQVINIGLLCIQSTPSKRPTMSNVIAMLVQAVECGRIRVDGKIVSPSYIVHDSQKLSHFVHRHEPPVMAESVTILEEDVDVITVCKPASVPVHACGQYRKNTVVGILQAEHNSIGPLFPVHRLDRLVSGLLILARNVHTANFFRQEIEGGCIQKQYVAKVKGVFPADEVEVNAAVIYDAKEGKSSVKEGGTIGVLAEESDAKYKDACTRFQRLSTDGNYSLVRCMPQTGRTHQIRVHLQHLGHPIANDALYLQANVAKRSKLNTSADRAAKDHLSVCAERCSVRASEEFVIDPMCTHCPNLEPSGYGGDEDGLWLHCVRYASSGWAYECPLPKWAI